MLCDSLIRIIAGLRDQEDLASLVISEVRISVRRIYHSGCCIFKDVDRSCREDEMRLSESLLRSSGWTVRAELTHLELASTSALPVFQAPCCKVVSQGIGASDRLPRQSRRGQQRPRYTKENGVSDAHSARLSKSGTVPWYRNAAPDFWWTFENHSRLAGIRRLDESIA